MGVREGRVGVALGIWVRERRGNTGTAEGEGEGEVDGKYEVGFEGVQRGV